jgi:hypothetical protein
MADCVFLTREMLKDPVDLRVADDPLDFPRARALADRRAREAASEPMLLAWYDRAAGAFSPQVTSCSDDKPAWLTYAQTRGGDLIIDINDEAYVFVYRRNL